MSVISDDNPEIKINPVYLQDDNGTFIRTYVYDLSGTTLGVVNTDLSGAAYSPVGTVSTPSSGGSSITDHGALTGLSDDDHIQYLNTVRHALITGNPHGVTKSQVGLSNVDNTSDVNKPVSTIQATAISTAVSNHESAIDPHPQYETSAEAQAKVNAHAILTNNPHSVTKTQVGLGNVDNTSDVNKPVSIAQQAALDLKYAASNPNGYETASQLNSRDTSNRNRANHTGVQLAATISDFAATVRSTVLTGISFVTSTAVIATDSILTAIGKLQAQITTLTSSILSKVFGNEYEDFIQTTTFSTTSGYGTPATAASFTTTSKVGGRYFVMFQWNYTINSISTSQRFWIFVNGVQQDNFIELEGKDSTDDIVLVKTVPVNLASGTHTLQLRAATESANQVVISLVRAYIWRVS